MMRKSNSTSIKVKLSFALRDCFAARCAPISHIASPNAFDYFVVVHM
ncbi:hypothetical protein ACNUDN_06361 [Mycobacterium sp. smrl_JER01]